MAKAEQEGTEQQGFDEQFQQLFTSMVELAFELVGWDKEEVDEVYVFGSMEDGYYYNTLYRINGTLVTTNNINTVSKRQFDNSSSRIASMLKLGSRELFKTANLFKEFDREVPTLMKMVYHPKTGAFDNDISYELHHSNKADKLEADVFREWYTELGGK